MATNLPIMQTDDQNLHMLQTRWASIINPLLASPGLQSSILKNINLVSGANVINHKLGRNLQGWRIVRLRGPATIYDTQDGNSQPALTLQLNSNATVVVDLEVF